MSDIVLGLATSHSPLLSLEPQMWLVRAADDRNMRRVALSDGRTLSYAELESERGALYAGEATIARFEQHAARAQQQLDRLGDELEAAAPDLVVIVGDDQEELFGPEATPAFAIYYGEEMVMHPLTEVHPNLPEWRKASSKGQWMDAAHRHPAAPDYARRLIEHLVDAGVDAAACAQVKSPEKAGFGHAFGFIVARLFRGRQTPVVPVMLNTYYPPNVPSAARCYDLGRKLATAIEASPDAMRVAVIASGGLSHFATDEDLDGAVMKGLRSHDATLLGAIARPALRSGSSEILNWILTAGAVQGLSHAWDDYIPVYRTPAGTGIGLGFACWRGT